MKNRPASALDPLRSPLSHPSPPITPLPKTGCLAPLSSLSTPPIARSAYSLSSQALLLPPVSPIPLLLYGSRSAHSPCSGPRLFASSRILPLSLPPLADLHLAAPSEPLPLPSAPP